MQRETTGGSPQRSRNVKYRLEERREIAASVREIPRGYYLGGASLWNAPIILKIFLSRFFLARRTRTRVSNDIYIELWQMMLHFSYFVNKIF